MTVWLTILFISVNIANSQSSQIIGIVLDGSNNSTLPYATISVINRSADSYSDEKGFFRIVNISEEDSIKVSFVGYQSRTIQIKDFSQNFNSLKDTIRLPLQPLLIELSGIEIKPINADSILNTALKKILKNYNQAYCSQTSFRGTQQVNNSFTQWIESYGEALFLPIGQLKTQKGQAYFAFDYARAAGWDIRFSLGYGHIFFIQSNFMYALPWKVELYSSKVVFSSASLSPSSNQLVKVQLTPKSSENKALQKIDKQFDFSINEPALFEGVQRTYWISLEDTTLTAVELFSKNPAMADLDHNKRNYYYRRFYFELQNDEGKSRLTKAFSTLRFSLPKQKSEIEHTYEFHFGQFKACPENIIAYRKNFGINKTTSKSGLEFWIQNENNLEYPKQFFKIPMKIDRSNKIPTKILSPFIYQTKALKDLADAPNIQLFQEIP